MTGIDSIGGAGGHFDPNRPKTSEERAEEAEAATEEGKKRAIEKGRGRVRARVKKMVPPPKNKLPTRGKSPDSGTMFDSDDFPEGSFPPAPDDGPRPGDGLNETA